MKAKPPTMYRRIVWVKQLGLSCWGCSDCSWLFNPANISSGNTFNGTVRKFESQRDKAFAGHACAKLPRSGDGRCGKRNSPRSSQLETHRIDEAEGGPAR